MYGVEPLALTATTASFGPTASARDVRVAALGVVLRVLAVAGDDRDDLAGRRAERRPDLGRVERGEAAGRAGAGVDEPAAARRAAPAIASIAAASASPARATAAETVASSTFSDEFTSVARACGVSSSAADPVSAALTASHTSGESGVARCVMYPHAS